MPSSCEGADGREGRLDADHDGAACKGLPESRKERLRLDGAKQRRSLEREVLAQIEAAVADRPDVQVFRGQGGENRFDVAGWDLPPRQRFQFGDLRIEGPLCTVVVEAESAGGVTNLVKYWPYLRAVRPHKRFLIVHLFRLASEDDYIAHRRLWEFLVDRITEDLKASSGLERPRDWDAQLFAYREAERPDGAVEYIRAACGGFERR